MPVQPKKEPQRDPWEAHSLRLEQRNRLTVTGVQEVLRFEAQTVVLRLEAGLLLVFGEGLALKQLAPEEGRLEVRGTLVNALRYEQAPSKGLLRRILG